MKSNLIFAFAAASLLLPLNSIGGEVPLETSITPQEEVDAWSDLRRPITNPTLFDLAIPDTVIHPLVIHNRIPSTIDTILGDVPVGGDYQVYALQLEIQLTERLSINATKDGYIDFNPDSTLSSESGWANISAGLKYAWLLQPENGLAANVQLLYEIPVGSDEVWQGNGDGVFIPSMNITKLCGPWQFVDQFGFKIPVDSSESSFFYNSAHVSYQLTDWFFPLIEVNYFRVLDTGDGAARFFPHAGGAVPAITTFEGGDLVNWGAANADINEDLVTLGIGFRIRCPQMKNTDIGFAWEFPLTDESESIMEDRFTLDATIRF